MSAIFLFVPFIGLSLALDGKGAPIHVEFQMRLHITVRVKESVKGDRGVGRELSKVIFERTGILVPVGSGMTNIHISIPIRYRYASFRAIFT